MTRILCVHQGMEMYGSDKSFVAAVAALDRTEDFTPTAVIPQSGPILKLFAAAGLDAVQIQHLWVLRKAEFAHSLTLGLPANLAALWRAMTGLRRYDLVYVNTAVIVDYLIASILTRRPVVVHVREIPQGIAMKVIRTLLRAAKVRVIYNSEATKTAFDLPDHIPQAVVYNGFDAPAPFAKAPYDGSRPLQVLCIGRLNSWKGQQVLIEACARLSETERAGLAVRIVGGVYKDQTHFRDSLQDAISQNGLGDTITMVDFTEDPSGEYAGADVVCVPSTLPEPFGRVAIEGMAYGCALLASDHGGLREIVKDGETGHLLPPADPDALATALRGYMNQPETVGTEGAAGQARFQATFTQDACDKALIQILRDWSGTPSAAPIGHPVQDH